VQRGATSHAARQQQAAWRIWRSGHGAGVQQHSRQPKRTPAVTMKARGQDRSFLVWMGMALSAVVLPQPGRTRWAGLHAAVGNLASRLVATWATADCYSHFDSKRCLPGKCGILRYCMYRESNITSRSSLFSQQLPTASCSYTCINVEGVEQGWPCVVLTALVNLCLGHPVHAICQASVGSCF
jgi:hypothetical protein